MWKVLQGFRSAWHAVVWGAVEPAMGVDEAQQLLQAGELGRVAGAFLCSFPSTKSMFLLSVPSR